jgi:DNA-binding response OmpR family regulator
MANILVVEDEPDLNALLCEQLAKDGHRVTAVFDGGAAVDRIAADRYDLVLLDWMLPVLDGPRVLREVRKRSLVPVIMLTARGTDLDMVNGLEAGADDYLAKPVHIRVLRARIAAMLRRTTRPTGEEHSRHGDSVAIADIRLDVANRYAERAGRELELTPLEFDLLELFCTNPGRTFSRDYLLERLWTDESDVSSRTVDTHIQRLRKKLGDGDNTLQTVWGVGYRLRAS